MSLPHKSSFKCIKVQLLGLLEMYGNQPSLNSKASANIKLTHSPRDEFLIQSGRQYTTSISEQPIGSSKKLNPFQLPPGDYEFPFNIPLSGRMLETITGLQHSYHTYQVQAIIERRFRGNTIISQDLRIYQTPDLYVSHQISSIPTVRPHLPNYPRQF